MHPREGGGEGTVKLIDRCACMADPRNTDPDDQNPRERGLQDRSDGPSISPWLVIGAILLIGALVYVISAVFV